MVWDVVDVGDLVLPAVVVLVFAHYVTFVI